MSFQLGHGFTHRDQLTSQKIKNQVSLVDDNMVWNSGKNFPVPKNISSLCSFYGMLNKIKYAVTMNEHMEPFLPFVEVKHAILLVAHLAREVRDG